MASLFAFVAAPTRAGSCEKKSVLQRGLQAFNSRQYKSVLTVNNGGEFGDWTWPEMCPDKFFAVGFSIRVERPQYTDTALNGIRLICSKYETRSFLHTRATSANGREPQYCPSGVLISFQLRVEPHKDIFVDDTAANNIRFRCSSNPVLEGPGMKWGEYGHWSQECRDGGICGIQTTMEEYQYALDDTALNDVRFHCCDRPQQ